MSYFLYGSVLTLLLFLSSCQSPVSKQKKTDKNLIPKKEEKTIKKPDKKTQLSFLDKKVKEFGKKSKNQHNIIKKKYYFKNTGNEPLVLLDHYSSCNCAKVNFNKKYIEPNDSAYIELVLNTSKKYGITRVYTVMTFNTRQKMYKVILKGNILE